MEQSEPAAVIVVHVFTKNCALWVRLDQVDGSELRELVTDSWAACARKRAVQDFLVG